MSLLKIFLPLYFLVWFAMALALRSYLTWKRTGRNPYRLGKTESAHDLIGWFVRLTIIALAGVVLVFSFSGEIYRFLIPIYWLQYPTLIMTGVGLMLISLVWILIAQKQMGNSWRVGIDEDHKTRLSRNPIFLGIKATVLGLFLVLPNAVTLSGLVLSYALIEIQVRLEEEYLSRVHGEDYEQYRRQTRRWM